jgi:arylsulfatase A-like enzyme
MSSAVFRRGWRLVAAGLLLVPIQLTDPLGRREASAAPGNAEVPNILLVVLDDVGINLIGTYAGGSAEPACTPTLDWIADRGVRFDNAWASPVCSATRAQILTGRYGFRTGVGAAIGLGPERYEGLPSTEVTIAEELAAAGYSTGLFGKWHLATGNADPADPLTQGFDWFEGSIPGSLSRQVHFLPFGQFCPTCPPGCESGTLGYYKWINSLNGVESCDTRYATSATVSDGLASIGGADLPEPWFVAASFNAIHTPFHIPPASLCPGGPECVCSGPLSNASLKARATLEAADRELRRLVLNLWERSQRPLYVLVIGDNGTDAPVAGGHLGGCSDPKRSKGTLYQGGLHVPLMIWTPGIVPRRVSGLVVATDLYATIAELAGVATSAEDSVSLVPYLEGATGSLRSTVYAETFLPNGLPFAPTTHQRAVRNDGFKLIRRTAATDELYELTSDPCEASDLFPPAPGSEAESAWQILDTELQLLGVG